MGQNQWQGWEAQLLQALGAPVNSATVGFLSSWGAMEQSAASFNPLNITWPPGSGSINSVGVQNYPSAAAGIAATVYFMEHGYTSIINALQSGNPYAHMASIASDLKAWSNGAYSAIAGHASGGSSGAGAGASSGTVSAPPPVISAADWNPATKLMVITVAVIVVGFFMWKNFYG